MRIGIGFYKTDRAIKDKLHKEKDRLAFEIFDFLTDHAEYEATKETVQNISFDLEAGQLITSWKKIEAYLTSWGIKAGNTAIRNRLEKLVKIGAISCEDLKKGSKNIGQKVTVIHLRNAYAALEPQGIEENSNANNEENNAYNNAYDNANSNAQRALEPQGIEENSNAYDNANSNAYDNAPFFKEVKELKELKELKDLKQAEAEGARVPQNNSIVNTFGQVFDYFFQKISRNITPAQKTWIEDFIDSGMEKDLLMAIMDKAGEGSHTSAPQYFINTCRDLLKNGITSLDKWQHNAALYNKNTGENRKGQQKTLSTRRGIAVPEGYYDDITF